jgi:hypothetical protein
MTSSLGELRSDSGLQTYILTARRMMILGDFTQRQVRV